MAKSKGWKWSLVTLVGILMWCASVPSFAKEEPKDFCNEETASASDIQFAALYRKNLEEGYKRGICAALESKEQVPSVFIEPFPYASEEEAFKKLKALIGSEHIDAIIGPTDTGVFLRAMKEFPKNQSVPVVSPLIEGNFKFQKSNYFFSANVTVNRRTRMLANFLSHFNLPKIMILHSDSQYGQKSEAAFRQAYLEQIPGADYRPLQYDSVSFTEKVPSHQIRQILSERPEGLGIFGTREEMKEIGKLLKEKNNSSTPYRPLIFTPTDFRPKDFTQYPVYSVSLGTLEDRSPPPDVNGDVAVLAHDTTVLLLNALPQTNAQKTSPKQFHENLLNTFSGGSSRNGKTLTEMKFQNGHSYSRTHIVYRDQAGEVSTVAFPQWWESITKKYILIFETRGWWVVASLVIILVIPFLVSFFDLNSWLKVGPADLLFSRTSLCLTSWMFIAFNVCVVLVLYVYLTETGRVPYDSPLTAMIIAMGPTTFLKSTLFKTKTGKAIGLASIYDKSMAKLNEQLMGERYESQQKFINILAFYNTLEALQESLVYRYSHARTKVEKEKLIKELNEAIENEEYYLEKRTVCARKLFEEVGWKKLEALVPESFRSEDPQDPYLMILEAEKYVQAQWKEDRDKILEKVYAQIQNIRERYEGEEMNLPEEKMEKRVFYCIRFLVQYGFYERKHLIALNLLPDSDREPDQEKLPSEIQAVEEPAY